MNARKMLVIVVTGVLWLGMGAQCPLPAITVGLVVEDVEDEGWGEDAWKGLLDAESAFDVVADYEESSGDHLSAVNAMAARDQDLIFTTPFPVRFAD